MILARICVVWSAFSLGTMLIKLLKVYPIFLWVYYLFIDNGDPMHFFIYFFQTYAPLPLQKKI